FFILNSSFSILHSQFFIHMLIGFSIGLILALTARATRTVDWSGAISGGLIACALFVAFGWGGVTQLMAFFAVGTASSQLGYQRKHKIGVAQQTRTWRNAAANAGVGGILALVGCLTTTHPGYALGIAASFAAAASDTVSGEIGRVYGRHPRLITTWKPAVTGENGAITLVGTLTGIVCSVGMATLAWTMGLLPSLLALGCVAGAGMAGNLIDSFLGATLEHQGFLDNEGVNLCCTTSAALLVQLYWFS
ncbi:MAG TPA: DUF92 domain-containing protein, partial [Acidobacteriota bacterium]|nr:DUF92 domain-containing protein [Acidobacteriota bacterium]